MILTLDLGTTTTKAVVWSEEGPLAVGRAEIRTEHPRPGWAEQDPSRWWDAVVEACAAAARNAPQAWSAIKAVCFSAARETFAPVDASGRALAPGIVWSDRRADGEAVELAAAHAGVEELHARTGIVVDGGAMVAKARWLQTHDLLAGARWLLAPRDLIVLRLTGVVATDRSLASRTGCYRLDGTLLPEAPCELLAPVQASTVIVGTVRSAVAGELGLADGVEVVLGAGDRACEVLGTGAGPDRPMVSWGTTANVAVPVAEPPTPLPRGVVLSAGARRGWLLECGLSAAGAAVDWLAALTGRPAESLADAAASVAPGSAGLVATAWFSGARAPWWQADARAALTGLTNAHGPGELARALMEAVAFDVARSLSAMGVAPVLVAAAGGGASSGLWPALLSSVVRCPVQRRRPELSGAAGALIVAGEALGTPVNLEDVNPVVDVVAPDPSWVEAYRRLRPAADRVAAAVIGVVEPGGPSSGASSGPTQT